MGPIGVGKTHLATSLGIAAAKKRTSTYFINCHDLLQQLRKAKLESRLESRLKHFCKYRLLIIDELGYLPTDNAPADKSPNAKTPNAKTPKEHSPTDIMPSEKRPIEIIPFARNPIAITPFALRPNPMLICHSGNPWILLLLFLSKFRVFKSNIC